MPSEYVLPCWSRSRGRIRQRGPPQCTSSMLSVMEAASSTAPSPVVSSLSWPQRWWATSCCFHPWSSLSVSVMHLQEEAMSVLSIVRSVFSVCLIIFRSNVLHWERAVTRIDSSAMYLIFCYFISYCAVSWQNVFKVAFYGVILQQLYYEMFAWVSKGVWLFKAFKTFIVPCGRHGGFMVPVMAGCSLDVPLSAWIAYGPQWPSHICCTEYKHLTPVLSVRNSTVTTGSRVTSITDDRYKHLVSFFVCFCHLT